MKQRSMVYAILCSLAINAAANLIFIPIFGFPSAAIVSFFTALSYVVLVMIL
jgi:O-antigen/teichoic acid export membrane protein